MYLETFLQLQFMRYTHSVSDLMVYAVWTPVLMLNDTGGGLCTDKLIVYAVVLLFIVSIVAAPEDFNQVLRPHTLV